MGMADGGIQWDMIQGRFAIGTCWMDGWIPTQLRLNPILQSNTKYRLINFLFPVFCLKTNECVIVPEFL